jgi:hypothetical protein
MDRSFLSQPDVINASRQFVCVRLTTYEDEKEAEFCRSLFIGRSGDQENTTFAILAPDGKTKLVRAGRSTRQLFANAADMARQMNEIATRYPAKIEETAKTSVLPITLTARLGVDVAASDGQPLIVVLAADDAARSKLEARLASLAWGKEFIGQFVYASAAKTKEIPGVVGLQQRDSFVFVEPDKFGQKGELVRQVDSEAEVERVVNSMQATLTAHHKTVKNERFFRVEAIKAGAFWDTKLPVTDREEAMARARTKQQIDQKK